MKRWWQFWRDDPPPAVDPAAVPERQWCSYDYVGRHLMSHEQLERRRNTSPISELEAIALVIADMTYDRKL